MGAWSAGNLGNDDALDWVAELMESNSAGRLTDPIEQVCQMPADELESEACCHALAACELIASRLGHPGPDVSDQIQDWLSAQRPQIGQQTIALAIRTIRRIREDSELRELWESSDALDTWSPVIEDLERRLRLGASSAAGRG